MKSSLLRTTVLSGILVASQFGGWAMAADIEAGPLPAVSAVNGKVEFGGGWADIEGLSSDEVFYGAASLSLPLGDTFGLQADFAAKNVFDETGVGGNLHLFTRDPNSHLLGVIAGAADIGPGTAYWAGGEAELYLDNISFELAAGYMNVDPSGLPSSDELFAIADVAFYATENFRLSVGASSIANFESAHFGAEYLFDQMPVSLKLDGKFGEDNFASVTAGISFYFGGNDSQKTLIRRHREDDPRNRVLDIFGSGASGGGAPAVDPCDVEFPDPEVCGFPEGS
jgi:hypothetical protein